MKQLKYLLPIFIFIFTFNSATAQLTEKYEAETIYLQSNRYIKNGQAYPIGFFGSKLKQEMLISPDAMIVFEKYQKQSRWYFVSGITVLGLLVTVSVIETQPLRASLFLGAGAVSILSFPLSGKMDKNFQKAIWLRNRDALK